MKTAHLPVRRRIVQTLALLAAAALGATLALPSAHAEKVASPPVTASKRNHGWKQSNVLSIDGDKNNVMVMEEYTDVNPT